MYAALTEETVRMVAEKGTQKGSADFGRRSSPKNNRQSDIHSDLAYCEKQYGEISLFPVESGRRIEKIGEQFNCLYENDRDHMHPKLGMQECPNLRVSASFQQAPVVPSLLAHTQF